MKGPVGIGEHEPELDTPPEQIERLGSSGEGGGGNGGGYGFEMTADPENTAKTDQNQPAIGIDLGNDNGRRRARGVATRGGATLLADAAAVEHRYTPWQAVKTFRVAFAWCIFVALAALLWGYDAQVGGGTLSIPAFRRDFGYVYEGEPVLQARWQSAFNSMSSVGGLFGGLSIGWISDQIGRRLAIGLASIISIGAVFIQFFTPTHVNGMLLAGKLINGFALGMFVAGASSYCAEISPLALRGITTGSVNLWIVIGQFLSNCVIEGTGSRDDRYSYRIPFAVQWIFPVLLLLGLPFAPESPWYLVRRGDDDRAKRTVAYLGGHSVDADLYLAQIKETIELEDHNKASSSYFDCFRGANRQRTVIAMMVFVVQQMTGVVFVCLGFSSYFFQLAGFNTSNSFKLGVGVTAIGIVGNLGALFTVNRFGRRGLYFWGAIACTIVNFIVGFSSLANTSSGRWSMAAFTVLYNFAYQISIGPGAYVIYSEVSSAKLRSKTVGVGICCNSICGLVANIVIPYLVNPDEANLGGKVGFIFGGLGMIGCLWTWFFVPETKNRTVDEIDVLFETRVPPRKFERTVVEPSAMLVTA